MWKTLHQPLLSHSGTLIVMIRITQLMRSRIRRKEGKKMFK